MTFLALQMEENKQSSCLGKSSKRGEGTSWCPNQTVQLWCFHASAKMKARNRLRVYQVLEPEGMHEKMEAREYSRRNCRSRQVLTRRGLGMW